MNEDLTRQLLRRIAALERRLGIVETSEAGAAHSHSSYLNRDGSVALTADWDIGDGRKLSADTLAARDAAGLSLKDDGGNLGVFVADGGKVAVGGTPVFAILESISAAGNAGLSVRDTNTSGVFVTPNSSGVNVISSTYHSGAGSVFPLMFVVGSSEVFRLNTDGTLTLTGAIAGRATAGSFRSFSTGTIADNSVYTFTPVKSVSVMILSSNTAGATGAGYDRNDLHGIFAFRNTSGLGAFAKIIAQASIGFQVNPIALTGTTGNDGFVTIGVDATTGLVYIENRASGNVAFDVTMLG